MAVFGLIAGGCAALAAWQGTLNRDAAAGHWIVLGLIGSTLLSALALGRGRQHQSTGDWVRRGMLAARSDGVCPPTQIAGMAVWLFLLTAIVAWDLVSFIAQTHALPTLSYYIGQVTRHEVGGGALFGVWIAEGAYLALGWRAAAQR
jgi:hypothetical protein